MKMTTHEARCIREVGDYLVVEGSHPSGRIMLAKLGIPRTTSYHWCNLYLDCNICILLGLCCTNRVKYVLPLSPGALSLQVP